MNSENISIQGFQLLDGSIAIVLTFGFCHDIAILKMAKFDKVDDIDIEPTIIFAFISFWTRFLSTGKLH